MRDGDGISWDNIRPTDAARVVSGRSPYQQGRDEERAAVLTYLRELREFSADCYAESIEAGEHLARPENLERG